MSDTKERLHSVRAFFLCKTGRKQHFFRGAQGLFVQNHEKGVFQRGTPLSCPAGRDKPKCWAKGKIERNYIITKLILFMAAK